MAYINPYRMFQGAFIPNAIMEFKDLSQSAKLMWARLAQYAGKDGRCFPKIEKLATGIGMSRSMARKVLNELKSKHFIHVKEATGKAKLMHYANEYFFLDHPVFHEPETVPSGGPINGLSGEPIYGLAKESPKMGPPIEENHIRESNKEMSENFSNSSDDTFSEKSKEQQPEQKVPAKKFSDADLSLSEKIFQAVLLVNPTVKKPNFDKWANTIRLMREQDQRSAHGIWIVFSFANKDQFWRQNVLSPAALRKNYSRIAGKYLESGGSLQPPKAKQPPKFRCKDCGFLDRGPKFCGPNGKLTPDAPACCNFAAADPAVAEQLRNPARRCA